MKRIDQAKGNETTMSEIWRQQIPGTDLEGNWYLNGNDLAVRVLRDATGLYAGRA
jgi:hypothetical protein